MFFFFFLNLLSYCKERRNYLISLINNTREYTYLYIIEDDEKGNKIKIECGKLKDRKRKRIQVLLGN